MQSLLCNLAKILAEISQRLSRDIEIDEALVRKSLMDELGLSDAPSSRQHSEPGSAFCQRSDSTQLDNLFFSIEKFHFNPINGILYHKPSSETAVSETAVSLTARTNHYLLTFFSRAEHADF